MDLSKSILSAQYNNKMVTPRDLGHIRGSGQFFTGNGMSSNWQQGQAPTYTQEFPKEVFPNQKYDIPDMAPVGERINSKWKFTEGLGLENNLKGDPYLNFALNDLHETPTALNSIFFNKRNVAYLSRRVVEDVHRLTGIKIKPQDENSLMVYMTNAYVLGHSGYLPTTSVVHLESVAQQRGEKECSLKQRLSRLNQTVLQQAVKEVLSGIGMYMTYYKDASSLPTPLALPTFVSAKGSNVLQPNVGMYSGNSQGVAAFNQRNNVIN